MRGDVPFYELKSPTSLKEALKLLSGGDARPFAGGTDLMVLLEAGHLVHRNFVSLWNVSELRGIETKRDSIRIGALATYSEIRNHREVLAEFPMLPLAARETGAIAIQNRGTLGGNIANASPAADSPPALLTYDAKLILTGPQGERTLDYSRFHLGYKKTALGPGELITAIVLPRGGTKFFETYRKVGTRKAQAISKVCFAGRIRIEAGKVADLRLALGSVAPIPLRCVKTEAVLKGDALDPKSLARARAELEREIAPIDDIRSTREYRARVAGNLLEDFLLQAGKSSQVSPKVPR